MGGKTTKTEVLFGFCNIEHGNSGMLVRWLPLSLFEKKYKDKIKCKIKS